MSSHVDDRQFYERLVEQMMLHFSKGPYEADVIVAKEQFFKTVGLQDEDPAELEIKMNQFSDWYLFSFKLPREGKTPVEVVLDGKAFPIAEEDRPLYQALASNRNGLFQLLKFKDGTMTVKDLFDNEKVTVVHGTASGFNKDEIFQTRLIPYGEKVFFGPAFTFHPPQVTPFIEKEVKKVRKMSDSEKPEARENLIDRLFRMRYKFDQYRHVGLNEIYSNESKLKV